MQGPIYLVRIANCLIIIGSGKIFKIEVNEALVAIFPTRHCAQLRKIGIGQNFGFKVLTWISTYWWRRTIMLKSENRTLILIKIVMKHAFFTIIQVRWFTMHVLFVFVCCGVLLSYGSHVDSHDWEEEPFCDSEDDTEVICDLLSRINLKSVTTCYWFQVISTLRKLCQ